MRSEDIARYVAGLEAEVKSLRVALPALPEVGPVTVDRDGRADTYQVGRMLVWARTATEAREQAMAALAVAAFLDAEAADTAPDTSRVTFGARHEGTGMVLLQHDRFGGGWGESGQEGHAWHQSCAIRSSGELGAAHAALAEVRKDLNVAEAAGVDVWGDGSVSCDTFAPFADDPSARTHHRVRRYLAREVQALVDQGLRGDDLNARLPYTVRDHRAPVEAADTSSDGEVAGRLTAAQQDAEENAVAVELRKHDEAPFQVVAAHAIRALDAHRAARTSEEQA